MNLLAHLTLFLSLLLFLFALFALSLAPRSAIIPVLVLSKPCNVFYPVLRIRDILVPTDPDPAIFVSDLLWQLNTGMIFFQFFFCYYFLKVHLHHLSMIRSHKEVAKQQESRFFLLFLLNDIRIHSRCNLVLMDPDPRGPKTRIRIRNTAFICLADFTCFCPSLVPRRLFIPVLSATRHVL
jgi:hypothetical protein